MLSFISRTCHAPLHNRTAWNYCRSLATHSTPTPNLFEVLGSNMAGAQSPRSKKLEGRAFYESIGSPRVVLAPMVDQSEFVSIHYLHALTSLGQCTDLSKAWRMLTRSFLPKELQQSVLAYTPMFHARLFSANAKYRDGAFEPVQSSLATPPPEDDPLQLGEHEWRLDGNPSMDRPLFVQFCANQPDELLASARYVQPFCDAVDLNLGCPQGIARKGKYGAFLQEDWTLIYNLINNLHTGLAIPVTAKMRILETKERTLEYAKMILSAGASIITVHGRRREQKGHYTGLADWSTIRYLRDNLPPETVIFANGNILQHEDIEACLEATGADAVMSAEGNLYDPSIFAKPPPVGQEGREYWRGKDGKGGYRMDAVMRRYMDIIHTHVLGDQPPSRKPLFLLGEASNKPDADSAPVSAQEEGDDEAGPPRKKLKPERKHLNSPNLSAMQPHLFHMLRPLVSKQTHVRDALAKARAGDMAAYENVLRLVEEAVEKGIREYDAEAHGQELDFSKDLAGKPVDVEKMSESSMAAVAKCRRPWFICQAYVRPLPKEAVEKGAITLSRKQRAALESKNVGSDEARSDPKEYVAERKLTENELGKDQSEKVQVPTHGMVCG